MNFPIFNHLKNDNLFQDKTTTVQLSTFVLTSDDKMPTLRKIKRGASQHTKPTLLHHI